MVVPVLLVLGLAADVDAEGTVQLLVGGGDDDREVRVAAAQVVDVLDELGGKRVGGGADGQCDERLVGVQARVAAVQAVGLQAADGLDDLVADDVDLIVDAGDALERVHHER